MSPALRFSVSVALRVISISAMLVALAVLVLFFPDNDTGTDENLGVALLLILVPSLLAALWGLADGLTATRRSRTLRRQVACWLAVGLGLGLIYAALFTVFQAYDDGHLTLASTVDNLATWSSFLAVAVAVPAVGALLLAHGVRYALNRFVTRAPAMH